MRHKIFLLQNTHVPRGGGKKRRGTLLCTTVGVVGTVFKSRWWDFLAEARIEHVLTQLVHVAALIVRPLPAGWAKPARSQNLVWGAFEPQGPCKCGTEQASKVGGRWGGGKEANAGTQSGQHGIRSHVYRHTNHMEKCVKQWKGERGSGSQ
eukprot:1143175-Pelagomonas_calceolata.AAC.4